MVGFVKIATSLFWEEFQVDYSIKKGWSGKSFWNMSALRVQSSLLCGVLLGKDDVLGLNIKSVLALRAL